MDFGCNFGYIIGTYILYYNITGKNTTYHFKKVGIIDIMEYMI